MAERFNLSIDLRNPSAAKQQIEIGHALNQAARNVAVGQLSASLVDVSGNPIGRHSIEEK